jgi:uncharacterized protein (TIGR02266 family)
MHQTSSAVQPLSPAGPRKTLAKPLIVTRARDGDGPRTLFGYAHNIGGGGLEIRTLRPKPPGTRHSVEFSLPKPLEMSVSCTCEVVWSRPYASRSPLSPAMGLRFVDLPGETADAIAGWIEHERLHPPGPARRRF